MPWRERIREELRRLPPYKVPRQRAGIKLDANECPYPLPADLAAALGRLLGEVPLHRYPDAYASELRGILSEQLGVAPECLLFGNGSDELIPLLVQTFGKPRRGETRARVAYPVPTFMMFRIGAIAGGAQPVEIPLREDFTLDPLVAERHLTGSSPNLVFLPRPNNPTGTLWERETVERIAERHPDTIIVVDEAYGEYASETMIDAVAKRPNLVVMRSMSKVGLAGVRLGILVGGAEVLIEIEKVRPPYNLSALAQRAAAFLLGAHRDRLRSRSESVVAERDRLYQELARRERVKAFPSRANFVLFRVPDADAVHRGLADRGVLVRNLSAPGPLAGCLRATAGTRDENDAFLRALDEALAAVAGTEGADPLEEQGDEEEVEEPVEDAEDPEQP